jgi:hypothetical protein
MRSDQTPFATGWYGQGLANVRPRISTYGKYQYDQLPPLPFEFRGNFAWLARQPAHGYSIASERPAENAEALVAVLKDATKRGLTLPPEFLAFFRALDLQERVRSCTDCLLDLSPVCVPSPLGKRGFLLRFLADSQGCIFWYLYLEPGTADHCVVASPDFYGSEAEKWRTEPPEPRQIIFVEEFFERFICRFWLENEIWFSGYEKSPMLAEGRQYLENYGRSAQPDE